MAQETALRADAVVVGTGAGGAPVAAVLAEAGLDVIVLEAGARYGASDFTGEEGEMIARLMTARVSRDSGIELYAGSCVGGSTVVNDALCWRTPPEVLEHWRREHGLEELGEGRFSPFVDRAWHDIHASPTGPEHLNRNAHHLEVGARRLGWAAEAMARNVRGCVNLGLCNLGCPSNAKRSTLLTYVPRAERAGALVLPEVRAERVEVSGGAVQAVVASGRDGARVRVEAPAVWLAAGVLGTPALLLRSGLGEASPAVGAGLQCHSSAYVTARFAEPVHAYYGPTMAVAVTEFADVNGRTGPGFMLESCTVAQVTAASGLPGFGAEHERAMRALPYLARCVVVLRDRARGRIRLDAQGRPEIGYAPDADDLARLARGVREAARAYLAAGALEVFLPINGSAPVRSEADLRRLEGRSFDARSLSLLYAVHLFGGAVMGADAERSVCDGSGAVRGVEGLKVCDASALPSNTGVNPQVTILANALRMASTAIGRAA